MPSAPLHSSSRRTKAEQQVLAVDVVADHVVERNGDPLEVGRQIGRPVHVDPDADHNGTQLVVVDDRLGQDAGELARAATRSASTTTRSFGHLRRGSAAATSVQASTAAQATAVDARWASTGASAGRSRIDISNELPAGACQVRSSRPRPAR